MNIASSSVADILKKPSDLGRSRASTACISTSTSLNCSGNLGVVGFLKYHLDQPVPSTVVVADRSRQFVRAVRRFCDQHGVPLISFEKGQRKEDVAREHLARFQGREGVLFVGRAQEKAPVFRTERRRRPETGAPYPWIVRSTAMVNHFYFYCVDADFGPFFLKFCSYFPYNAKLCINGHEDAKRQLEHQGIAYQALDNGFLSCVEPERLQRLCDGLSSLRIRRLVNIWFARLPHPYTKGDRIAGYRYDVSILQAEFALTQVLDRPRTGCSSSRCCAKTSTSGGPTRSS